MNYLKISLGIFLVLAVSRFIPHPPNFTNLIALSFYAPLFFGRKFIPVVLASFFLTDIFIGFHSSLFFTWGSVVIIGLIPRYFYQSLKIRLFGSLLGALVFYIITNFGVWLLGMYPNNLTGLVTSYILAIPFFGYSLISTITYSLLIEFLYKISIKKFKKSFKY